MTKEKLQQLAEKYFDEIKQIRETLHRDLPEPSLREYQTTAFIKEQLADLGLEEQEIPTTDTGAVYILRGGAAPAGAPMVALRADIDALEIEEKTGLPYASHATAETTDESGQPKQVPMMHACGHDGHTAILIGVAKILTEIRDELPGDVKFIFQPGEEGFAGARKMVEGGVLEGVEAIFALHGRERIQLGQIETAEIPYAAMDDINITVRGQGCHAAYAHLGKDPIVMAAHLVTALQTVVSREVAPGKEAVVTIGLFQGGTRRNIIPDSVRLEGTIRSRHPEVRERLHASVRRICEQVPQALGGSAEVEILPGYPMVRNNKDLLDLVRRVGGELFGEENVIEAADPVMGSEDFAFYLEEQGGVPGAMFSLGVETNEHLHSSYFDFGEKALIPGMTIMSRLALEFLSSWSAKSPRS